PSFSTTRKSPAFTWEASKVAVVEQSLAGARGRNFRRRAGRLLGNRWTLVVILLLVAVAVVIGADAKNISAVRMLTLVVRGVMLGGILALGAVGVTLIYGVLKMSNFAHGDYMTVGAYLGFAVVGVLPHGPRIAGLSFGYEFLVALLLVMPLMGLIAYGLDRFTFR